MAKKKATTKKVAKKKATAKKAADPSKLSKPYRSEAPDYEPYKRPSFREEFLANKRKARASQEAKE